MPDDTNSEVVVLVPETDASSVGSSSSSGSEPFSGSEAAVIEVFDAILDPGSSDPIEASTIELPNGESFVVLEPESAVSDLDGASPATASSTDPSGDTGIAEPIAVGSADTGDGSGSPDIAGAADTTATTAGFDDPTASAATLDSGIATSDRLRMACHAERQMESA